MSYRDANYWNGRADAAIYLRSLGDKLQNAILGKNLGSEQLANMRNNDAITLLKRNAELKAAEEKLKQTEIQIKEKLKQTEAQIKEAEEQVKDIAASQKKQRIVLYV